jgi:EmrB/QacA subfamily drug resistance transporter
MPEVSVAAAAPAKLDRATVLALVAMALGVFVIANDFTALSVAIPSIERDLGTTISKAQWVINGYAMVFGVLIVTGGRLADLFGRKRMFMIGAAFFSVFSLVGGAMPSVVPLILCRGLMGVGGALIWPAVLGMTYALLPEDKAGLAGGLILGVAGTGNAVGPLLGGLLTDELNWRFVFFLNVPVTVFAVAVTWRVVRESTVESAERGVDYPGIAVLSGGILLILIALDRGDEAGFGDPAIVALLGVGALLLFSFLLVERRQGPIALVPRDVLRNVVFSGCCMAVLLISAIFFSALLYLPQFMEKILGYSALGSGIGLLPLMVVFAGTSFVAGSLYGRMGARLIVSSGAACLAAGIFLLSFVDGGSSYTSLVPGMIVLGVGVGLFYSSITTAAVTALDPSRSSLAGGIVYMCQIAGGAVGLGLNTAFVTASSSLPDGISVAFKVDAALAVLGLFVVLAVIGRHTEVTPRPMLRAHHRAHA